MNALNKVIDIGVLGFGAIGHLLAAQFWEKSGFQLHFFNRSERNHFRFQSYLGRLIDSPIQCHTQPTPIKLDWLLVCLKAYHYPAAAGWFTELIHPTTRVVVLRNGLDLAAPLMSYTGTDMVLPVLVDSPTQCLPSQHYRQLASGQLTVPQHPLRTPFQSILAGSELKVKTTTDFNTASWEKLIESAAVGAITCLSGATCHILKNESIQLLYNQLLEEGIQVARADGAQITEDYLPQMREKANNYPPEKGSSMLTDRLAGRPIEVMAKNGIISQKGKELGIGTPLSDSFTVLLQFVNHPL